jgi:hypothetical protein
MHRRSIKAKSLGLFVGYVLALCLVYSTFTVMLLRREAAATQGRLEQMARMLAAEIDTHVAAGRERLATVARLPGLVYGLGTIREARGEGHIPPWTTLHYLFFKSPVFSGGAFLLDRGGTVLWAEPPGLPWVGRSLADYAPLAPAFARGASTVCVGL